MMGAVAMGLACGEVPTFEDNIASVSAIELPSLVVIAGDRLRDSTGAVAPVKVEAFDIAGKVMPGVPVTYILSPIDTGIHIDASGILTASDSLRVVHIVARVGDRIQTLPALLNVVAVPDQVVGTGTTEPLVGFPAKGPLQVAVTGTRATAHPAVPGLVVRYQIVTVNGTTAADPAKVFLVDEANTPLHADPLSGVDTTDVSGIAKRFVVVSDSSGIRSVEIRATVRPIRGETIAGNPVTFSLPLKKTP
jgi:hypothetical protein